MKKHRLFHIFLSFILIFSMLSLPVSAAGESASAIAEAITLDLLTTQSSYAVTKALDFTAANTLAAENGAQISWRSNTPALAVSGAQALVTRGDSAQTAVLTATVTKDGATAAKNLSLTIPAVSTYVFESEGFGRPALTGEYVNTIGSRWAASTNEAVYSAKVKQNDDGNYVLNCSHDEYVYTNKFTKYSLSEMPETKKITIEFTVTRPGTEKYSDAEAARKEVYYDFYFNGELAADKSIENNAQMALRIKQTATDGWVWSTHTSDVTGTKYGTYPAKDTPTRFKYEFTFNEDETLCSVWQDGTKLIDNKKRNAQINKLDNFTFHVLRYGDSGSFYFDDFVVTADKGDMTAEGLTTADMGALTVKNYTTPGTYPTPKLDITTKYDETSSLKQTFEELNGSVNTHFDYYGEWLVDNASGAETQLHTQAQDDTAPFQINTLYLGANHGPTCVLATSAGHGKTIADVGSYWQDSDERKWTLAQVVNADKLKFICDEFQNTSGDWRHRFVMPAGTLSCIDEGSTATLSITAASDSQLYPAIKGRTSSVKAVTNGIETELTMGEAQEFTCDRIILNETYIITDPRKVPELLRAGKGQWTEDTLTYALGEDMIRYHQTLTIMEDGTVLTEYDHEILMNLDGAGVNYGGYQYYMRTNPGGGVLRYMPDTKAFTDTHRDGTANVTFDFSAPWQMIGSDGKYDYPNSAQPYESKLWADENKAPSRMVDYMMNANGTTAMGFASGYLPVGDGEPTARLSAVNRAYYFYNSAKSYPFFVSQGKNTQGAKITGASYRKYADTAKFGEEVSAYSVSYGDEVYYYIDFLEAANGKTLTLPESFGTDVTLFDMSGETAGYKITGNKITVSGAQKDYLILKASAAGAAIRKTKVNALGTVEAVIGKLGTGTQSVAALCAGYKNGRLVKTAVCNQTLTGENTIVTFGDFSAADTYRVFLWSGTDTLQPLCAAQTGAIN